MDSGSALMVAVGVLAMIALVLVGAAKPDGQRAGAGRDRKASKPSVRAQEGRVGVSLRHGDKDDDEGIPLPQSTLMIPPPDEARIQAVAPNNDLRGRR